MVALLALLAALQTSAPGGPSRAGLVDAPDPLARLPARGVRMLISTSNDDEAQGRPSRPADRCYSAGELASGGARVCLYDCEGETAALPVPSEHACPVTYRATR